MKDWEEAFRRSTPLKLYVMHTGYVHMRGNIHFNKADSRFKTMPGDNRLNPVFAHLVVHPVEGCLLLDTGLHPSFSRHRTGNFGPLLGRMVETRAERGRDVAGQLKELGISLNDVRNIILSHLHLDHPSALPLFSENKGLRVYVDGVELRLARSLFGMFKGYIKSHLAGLDCRSIEYPLSMQPFKAVADFFGDGSVFVLRTPGHTPGHVSVLLNAAEGPILLTFDAAHRKANLDHELPPVGHYPDALESVRSLKGLSSRFQDMRVIYGHDPDQLTGLDLAPRFYS